MAGGKLTPRQKMINLMYLVFIAMLALNMSKEVLSAFGILNSKLIESNQIADANNNTLFADLSEKAENQPGQYKEKKEKVEQVRQISADFSNYLESLKSKVTTGLKVDEDGNLPYEQMDKGDVLDNLFFKGDKVSKEGQEFLDRIKNYSSKVKQIAGSDLLEETKIKLDKRFSIADVNSKKVGKAIPWIDYHYKGFPAIASLTKLTQLQFDVKTTENEIISGMFLEGVKRAASLTGFEAIVVPDKTAFFAGETVTGKIILGKKDPNLKAHAVTVNGKVLGPEAMKAGQTEFSFGAGNVGEQDITGEFQFKEGDSIIKLPIKGNYVVVPKPNSATISADKMNVVYRGVKNPMTISFAGVSDNNVIANAPGLVKAGKPGQYMMSPGQGVEVPIQVSATLPDGTKVSDKKVFRIKNIPTPQGAIAKQSGELKGSKSRLENSEITVELPDFDFDLNLRVTQFTMRISGKPSVVVNGNRLDARAKSALATLGRGDIVTFSEIKSRIEGGAEVSIKSASPVFYEIQ